MWRKSHAIPMPVPTLYAREDPSLSARVVQQIPLHYAAGADPALDRPSHVRAGSALALIGEVLVVVQDDANFVALLHPKRDGEIHVEAVTLPAGPGGVRQFDERRGNKYDKHDFEACIVAPGPDGDLLVAFGSGGLPVRERILVVAGLPGQPRPKILDASRFYARLRAERGFSGSELNVEGAVLRGGRLRLFQRGNGAPSEVEQPCDATCELDWPLLWAHLADPLAHPVPPLERITRYRLGEAGGVPLTFTDAAADGDRTLYLACAEASPDALRDGPVSGLALGLLDESGARYALVRDAAGRPFCGKAEGLAPDPRHPDRVLLVIDRDDPDAPSELIVVERAGY